MWLGSRPSPASTGGFVLRQEKNPAEVGLRDTGVPLKNAPGAPSYRGRGRRFGYPGARGCIPAGSRIALVELVADLVVDARHEDDPSRP